MAAPQNIDKKTASSLCQTSCVGVRSLDP